jgi:DNA-binding NarL/FixJ family response regulator
VGEATDGAAGLKVAQDVEPDIAVIDISMPGLGGVELVRQLAAVCPRVRAIALTVHEDRAYVQQLLQAGARGYLLKRSAAEDLVRAVRAVAEGGMYLDPAIADRALGEELPARGAPGPEPELSPREQDVLRLTAQGFSNKEIAGRLEVSMKTVETYKARASDKLGLRSRAEIVRYGAGRGWLDELREEG